VIATLAAAVLVALVPAAEPGAPLLQPLPDRGPVPPIVAPAPPRAPQEEIAFRGRVRELRQEIRRIRRQHLGDIRVAEIRAAGIAKLGAIDDPAAFEPLVDELAREKDDVRLAVLDHLAARGAEGQAALARIAIHDEREAIRNEATMRMVSPAGPEVLRVLDTGLRSTVHDVANRAGALAGALRAVQAIPLLIFAQATADRLDSTGDVAWIAIATQTAFVAAVEPVVGSGAGAFQPIPGVVQEGTVLRVVDAVVIFYRTEVHRVLVMMTTDEWGQATAGMGYDIRTWWAWYNETYVPFVNDRARTS
jgi:hypothetical protein